MHPQGKSSAVKQKDPGTVLACRDLTAIKLTWWSQQSPRALLRLAMQPTSLHISSHCSPGLRPSVLAMGCRLFKGISPTLLGAPGISQAIRTGSLWDRFQM